MLGWHHTRQRRKPRGITLCCDILQRSAQQRSLFPVPVSTCRRKLGIFVPLCWQTSPARKALRTPRDPCRPLAVQKRMNCPECCSPRSRARDSPRCARASRSASCAQTIGSTAANFLLSNLLALPLALRPQDASARRHSAQAALDTSMLGKNTASPERFGHPPCRILRSWRRASLEVKKGSP